MTLVIETTITGHLTRKTNLQSINLNIYEKKRNFHDDERQGNKSELVFSKYSVVEVCNS